jgi:hypothetical protein
MSFSRDARRIKRGKRLRSARPTRDVDTVIAEHKKELMAKQGVVGVHPGGKLETIKVVLVNPALEGTLPRMIEGFPVVVEIVVS